MTATEALLRRDRLVVAACMLVICILSWWYVFAGAGAGTGMSTLAMTNWDWCTVFTVSAVAGGRVAVVTGRYLLSGWAGQELNDQF
ncbi:MAG: hypothetical protein OEV47_16555, partial [Gammaproteobacteria bacterium]|nr:hypothetical protein [Gammaproteobacteria bacterium]